MKLRPMIWVRWVELMFGAFLPTIFIVPFFVTLLGISLLGISVSGFSAQVIPALLLVIIPMGAVVLLWLLILCGPEQINQRPILRWLTLTMDILGFAYVLLFFVPTLFIEWKVVFLRPVSFSFRTIVRGDDWRFLCMGVIGPVIVGLRYLPALLRGTKVDS